MTYNLPTDFSNEYNPPTTRLDHIQEQQDFDLEHQFALYGYSSLIESLEGNEELKQLTFNLLFRYLILNQHDINIPKCWQAKLQRL